MTRQTILIVDDEADIRELVGFNLNHDGYDVINASSGERAVEKAIQKLPDLILLDLMLPGIDGLEVCKRLKKNPKTEKIPVIMLTAKGDEADIITGLELGADDYVTKPFSPRVLMARIKRVIQRTAGVDENHDVIQVGELTIDASRHQVLAKDKQIELTFTEFAILQTLAKRPGLVFTRYQIVDSIRGGNYVVSDRAVDVQIVSLRKKLGNYGEYIETVRGIGYRFKD